ncbi:adenine deaminase [Shiella aurantiaca]|uniref:adenine deaminase n=1 Tax=Shiella aurantiaca TaxID=3058365 RepID=UPI0029F5C7D1|nr:adenine deaminase [Shiella aurantiaca]
MKKGTNESIPYVAGYIVDVLKEKIFPGRVYWENGRITEIKATAKAEADQYILPGFIDAHVHIESSMLIPSEFARMAVVHGTVGTVSDPHEIANVMGIKGVRYMIENGKKTPFHFHFGAPSCVPATSFETAGAEISVAEIEELFDQDGIGYLAEMMNWPGVLGRDAEVMAKIEAALKRKLPVDGHAPGLRGKEAKKYAEVGISTDHECFTREEALDKLKLGMKILIREGSAAKNFEALIDLLNDYPAQIMFCSDDKHPDNLAEGHINQLVVRALQKGIDLFKVLRAASVNPVQHYKLKAGLLQKGDSADFIVIDNPYRFQILHTYCQGTLVAENGKTLIPSVKEKAINHFKAKSLEVSQLAIKPEGSHVRVILVEDGQLVTQSSVWPISALQKPKEDILKLVVLNRYTAQAQPAIAYIKNVGLKNGAIASTVAHDSHNIIAVGTSDDLIAQSINLLIESKGGISAVSPKESKVLALPVAGLMSTEDGYQVAKEYAAMDALAKKMGSTLQSPYMSLSFMALLVIPELKLSDKGLFDGNQFSFTPVFTTMETHEKGKAESILNEVGKKIDEVIEKIKATDFNKEMEAGMEQLKKEASKLEAEARKFREENKDKFEEAEKHLVNSAKELRNAFESLIKKVKK